MPPGLLSYLIFIEPYAVAIYEGCFVGEEIKVRGGTEQGASEAVWGKRPCEHPPQLQHPRVGSPHRAVLCDASYVVHGSIPTQLRVNADPRSEALSHGTAPHIQPPVTSSRFPTTAARRGYESKDPTTPSLDSVICQNSSSGTRPV